MHVADMILCQIRSNLISNVQPMGEGKLGIFVPFGYNAPFPLFAPDIDTGIFIKGILLNREKTLGKQIYASTDYYTIKQVEEDLKSIFSDKQTLQYVQTDEKTFKSTLAGYGMPDFVQEELYENMMFMWVHIPYFIECEHVYWL